MTFQLWTPFETPRQCAWRGIDVQRRPSELAQMGKWIVAMVNRTDFEVFIKYPLQTLALLLGGTAFTAGTGMLRYGNPEIALAFGALASVILAGAGTMMLHSDAWEGSDDEWGAVATDPRQRLNFMLVSIGMVVVGVAAMWLGFGPGMLVARVLLIAGGSLLFLMGVISFVGWLEAHRRFG